MSERTSTRSTASYSHQHRPTNQPTNLTRSPRQKSPNSCVYPGTLAQSHHSEQFIRAQMGGVIGRGGQGRRKRPGLQPRREPSPIDRPPSCQERGTTKRKEGEDWQTGERESKPEQETGTTGMGRRNRKDWQMGRRNRKNDGEDWQMGRTAQKGRTGKGNTKQPTHSG